MTGRLSAIAAVAGLSVFSAVSALADTIPYSHIGTIAPQTLLLASSTGNVTGYFVQGGSKSGGTAGYTDTVRLVDLTTGYTSAYFFNNQTTAAGAMVNFGSVNKGDTLIFELYDQTINEVFATTASYSADGVNHGYVTPYGGGTINGTAFPAGTYVGMEDLDKSNSDFNYNDDSFLFTNVTAVTPEPASFALLGTGVLSTAAMLRRRLGRRSR